MKEEEEEKEELGLMYYTQPQWPETAVGSVYAILQSTLS